MEVKNHPQLKKTDLDPGSPGTGRRRERGGGGRELCLGNRVSVLWMKTVLEVYDGDGNMDVFNSTKLELRLPRWCY